MAKSLFDHVNAIYAAGPSYYRELGESDRKSYSMYMINRFVSMCPDYLPIVNEIQKYSGLLDNGSHYLFFAEILPRRKQFHKYIKASKEIKIEPWLLELLAKHYWVSTKEAADYVEIFLQSKEGKVELQNICGLYGIEEKKVLKAIK